MATNGYTPVSGNGCEKLEVVVPTKMSDRFRECADELERFGITPELGCILANPLETLPPYFEIWEKLARNTQSLIDNGTLRNEIHKMPFLQHEQLQTHRELRLAHTCLTALLHGYVWMAGEKNVASSVPKSLAVPVCGVSERLGIEPAARHYTFVLNNWRLVDPSGKPELDNVETIIKLRAGEDESWFFMVAFQMELDAGPGLCAIVRAQKAVKEEDVDVLRECLLTIASCITRIELALRRIHERCRPHVFYNVFRPYINGWDADAFTSKGLKGLIYEGVSPEPKAIAGGSGAQSAILYAFDSALGVDQPSPVYNKFFQMLCPAHKDFVEAVRTGPSIQSYVVSSKEWELRKAFDDAVRALQNFRSYHLQVAARYIVLQSNRKDTNQAFANQAKAGTGGTDYMQFLKGIRDSTKNTLLQDP